MSTNTNKVTWGCCYNTYLFLSCVILSFKYNFVGANPGSAAGSQGDTGSASSNVGGSGNQPNPFDQPEVDPFANSGSSGPGAGSDPSTGGGIGGASDSGPTNIIGGGSSTNTGSGGTGVSAPSGSVASDIANEPRRDPSTIGGSVGNPNQQGGGSSSTGPRDTGISPGSGPGPSFEGRSTGSADFRSGDSNIGIGPTIRRGSADTIVGGVGGGGFDNAPDQGNYIFLLFQLDKEYLC